VDASVFGADNVEVCAGRQDDEPRYPIAKRHRGIAEMYALDLIPSALTGAVIAADRTDELVPKLT
jgi:hypothetical protein